MIYSHDVEQMCSVAQGASHGCAPIPEEENGYIQEKSKIFLVYSRCQFGVLLNKVLVN